MDEGNNECCTTLKIKELEIPSSECKINFLKSFLCGMRSVVDEGFL